MTTATTTVAKRSSIAASYGWLRMNEWAPICAAFLTRFTFLVFLLRTRGQSALIAPDTASYVNPGRALLHGHFGWPVPEIERTPGYPLFAALTGMWGNHVVWTAIAQIALECVSTWLVMRIARQLSGSAKVSRLAGYLYAIEPLAIMFACLILSEALYTTALLAMTSVLLDYRREPRWGRLAHAWMWLVVSAYVRPTSYYLPFVVSAYLLLQLSERRFWQRLKASAATVLVCMSLMGIWQVRNDLVTGYRGFSSVQETNLYYYLAAGVQAAVQHRSLLAVQDELKLQLARNSNAATWSRAQEFAFMKHEALHTIASHPWVYARLHVIGMGHVLFGPHVERPAGVAAGPLGSAKWMLANRPAVLLPMIFLVVLQLVYYACALRGVVRSKSPGQGLLLWMALYFVLIAGGPQADSRYRLPIVPSACALAAIGIIGQSKSGRKLETPGHRIRAEASA